MHYSWKNELKNENLLVQENIVYFSDDLKIEDRSKKRNIALKLHYQFSHSTAQKLISLLKDINVEGNKLMADVSDNSEICFQFKKPKPRSIVGFPLAECFSETVALLFASIKVI